jgi:beta-N-acetylhexosaminidase
MIINKTKENFIHYFNQLPPLQQAGFFLWPSIAHETLTNQEKELLTLIKPSGVILFKRNLKNTEQSAKLISQIKDHAIEKNSHFDKDFIVSIDEEGGRVSRLPVENIRGQPALTFADRGDQNGLIKQVQNQCLEAKKIGINCLLAPVADILTEENNPVMGDRCFGRDAKTVSQFACLVHKTIQDEKLWSCAKHFPGHGNTLTDSHKEISVSNISLEELKKREWLPFEDLIQKQIPFIMAAHVLLPQIDAVFPATLSYKILTQQLRNELGFNGLILSDDLRMNAIALHYHVNKKQDSSITEDLSLNTNNNDAYLMKACIDSLNAGCDILLSCQSIEKEFIIADSIAKELTKNPKFKEAMLQKAWHIFSNLASHF